MKNGAAAPVLGRYVSIQKQSDDYIQLNEIYVYADMNPKWTEQLVKVKYTTGKSVDVDNLPALSDGKEDSPPTVIKASEKSDQSFEVSLEKTSRVFAIEMKTW